MKEKCFCCGMEVHKNDTEYHHYPISKINGGECVIPLCTTCHNHVDRVPMDKWALSMFFDLVVNMDNLNRVQRIFFMKMIKITNFCMSKKLAAKLEE